MTTAQPRDRVSALVARLITATRFEDAARWTLVELLACADTALAGSEYQATGQLLRAMVHLRPTDSYRRLFGIEHPEHGPVDGMGYLTSASVWRWVSEHGCSVSHDVRIDALHPWLPPETSDETSDETSGETSGETSDETSGETSDETSGTQGTLRGTTLAGQATRTRTLERDVTHVHIVPLKTPGGRVDGLITLEARCKPAIGREFIWQECQRELETLATVAAPYLDALPADARAAEKVRTDEFLPVVGASMASIVEIVEVFADQEETLLISGPTGAGKSRLARWSHERSSRKERPFETLDLLSVPRELQMAELVGWKRGAFTGATNNMPGALTRAAGGTLFIDEIDKLSLEAQSGLLRVLEERRYRPLGDNTEERIADVRFIVGTNANLPTSVREGRFREDLFYRINVLPVRLPALAERRDEVPGWARFMLERCSAGKGRVRLAQDAVEVLEVQPWPGNLRQMDNIIRRTYAFARAARDDGGDDLVVERRHVERALAFEDGVGDSTTGRLWRAAQALARAAVGRSQDGGEGLALDLIDGFRGLVLGAAVLLSSREEAFRTFQREHLLVGRNHHRALKRELERAAQLVSALGDEIEDAALRGLLDDD